jgi:exodeoxyribonuclease VII small subunit
MPKTNLPIDKMAYEQALEDLEGVVTALETGQPTLEDALSLFERGQALARRCADLLDKAELRIRKLTDQEPDLPEAPETED